MPMPRTSLLPPLSMPTATFSDRDAAASFVHLDVDLGAQAADLAFGEYPGIPIALTDRRPARGERVRTLASPPLRGPSPPSAGGSSRTASTVPHRSFRMRSSTMPARVLPVTITVAVAPTDPLGAVLTVLGAPVRVWGAGRRPCCSRTSTRAISPGRVREKPAGDCQQCNQQGKRHRQRSGAARGAAARRPSALWSLQSQNVCGLWRQGGALSLRGRSREPRHRALHLVRRLAGRSCRRHGGVAGSRSASIRRSSRSMPRRARHRPPSGSWSFSRRPSRPRMRAGNTMRSILRIVSWPASLSGAGTRHGRSCTESSARLPRSRRGSRCP
jgi:hypothetical protein